MATQEQREADAALVPTDSDGEGDVPMKAGLLSDISLAQVMMLLTQLVQAMPENIAAAVKKDDKNFSHSDNVKLDNRNFVRIKTFTNKQDAWKEWKKQFHYVIQNATMVLPTSSLEWRRKWIRSTR